MPKCKHNHKGVDFPSHLIVLDSKGIDIILGMDWLTKYHGVIDCAQRLITMKHTSGTKLEYQAISESVGEIQLNLASVVSEIPVDKDNPDVFP